MSDTPIESQAAGSNDSGPHDSGSKDSGPHDSPMAAQASARIERWRGFVDREPDHPLHNFALAQALLAAGDWVAGERAFARCLELDPTWMVAAIKRGRCLVALERWDEARAALQRGADLAVAQHHEEPFAEIRELQDQIPD